MHNLNKQINNISSKLIYLKKRMRSQKSPKSTKSLNSVKKVEQKGLGESQQKLMTKPQVKKSSVQQPIKPQLIQQYEESLNTQQIKKQLKQKGMLSQERLIELIQYTENILKNQPNVLKVVSPVIVVGDIHGQFFDLLNIFQKCGTTELKKYLFLGDYVDRGLFCIEVVTFLLVCKVKNPKNVLLLRGNHEGRVMTSNFNFKIQCQKKYGINMYQRFIQLFCKFPLCAVIDQVYFAVHGGISPDIIRINDLEKINRFVQIHNKGVICDLVWSDPSQNSIPQWEPNAMRGCSYYYGKIQAKKFLKDNKIKMIIRGHEVQIQGFSYQKTSLDEKLTLTIFSAPNYCDTYKNKGAVAIIHNGKISIQRFTEVNHPFILSNYMNLFEFSMPGVCQLVGKLLLYLLRSRSKNHMQQSVIDDKLLQQLNALQRIELIHNIIEQKNSKNNQIILKQKSQTQSQISQELAKSYKIASQCFLQKKLNDSHEMYPDQQNTLNTNSIKQKVRMSLVLNEIPFETFGPKIQMKNNILKKILFQQDSGFDVNEDSVE